jgi:hypothetical protein
MIDEPETDEYDFVYNGEHYGSVLLFERYVVR